MKETYLFLSIIVPGPNNPKNKIDVFLQPLIVELKQLWEAGMQTYDLSRKQNFQMKASLMQTSGKLACPYCMEHSQEFTFTNGRKTTWFDNHRKFLPFDHAFRRNKNSFLKNRIEMAPPPPIMIGPNPNTLPGYPGWSRLVESHWTIPRECTKGPYLKEK